MPDWPLLAITPTTVNGWFGMRMIWPIGFDVRAEELIADDAAEHGDLRRRSSTSCGVKNAPSVIGHDRMSGQVDVGALHLRVPVLIAGDDLAARVRAGGDVLHARQLRDRRGVVGHQRAGVALALPDAALR